jgi:hypothetical protein
MRVPSALALGLLLSAAGAVGEAAEKQRGDQGGRVGVDIVAAPALGFGVPIRISPNLTLRAIVGFGSTQTSAAAWSLGGDLRYTFRPQSQTSAYASVQGSYLYGTGGGYQYYQTPTGQNTDPVVAPQSTNGGMYGLGLGVTRRLGRSTSLYGEARYGRVSSTGVYDSWGMWDVGGGNTVSFALGATFGLR